MSPCQTCMKLRARFVLWLGKVLGVMTDAPQPKETRMEWTMDQLMAIIGNKEVEIIGLRMQLSAALEKLQKCDPQENVVSLQKAKE